MKAFTLAGVLVVLISSISQAAALTCEFGQGNSLFQRRILNISGDEQRGYSVSVTTKKGTEAEFYEAYMNLPQYEGHEEQARKNAAFDSSLEPMQTQKLGSCAKMQDCSDVDFKKPTALSCTSVLPDGTQVKLSLVHDFFGNYGMACETQNGAWSSAMGFNMIGFNAESGCTRK